MALQQNPASCIFTWNTSVSDWLLNERLSTDIFKIYLKCLLATQRDILVFSAWILSTFHSWSIHIAGQQIILWRKREILYTTHPSVSVCILEEVWYAKNNQPYKQEMPRNRKNNNKHLLLMSLSGSVLNCREATIHCYSYIFLASVKKLWLTHKIINNAWKQYLLATFYPNHPDTTFPNHANPNGRTRKLSEIGLCNSIWLTITEVFKMY